MVATRQFADERRGDSWRHVITTLAALVAAVAVAAAAPWWPLRLVAAALEAFLLLRVFILYHDHMHGALLRRSRGASWLFHLLGLLMLSPPRVWQDTHNVHHANTARLEVGAVGTYSLWTVRQWTAAPWHARLRYRLERHPLNMLFGYLTVFLVGMCLLPFAQRPVRYASSGFAARFHVALALLLDWTFNVQVALLTLIVPFFVACSIGSYLFYVQHNAEGISHGEEGR